MKEFSIGQTVYIKSVRYKDIKTDTIVKVGKKWVYLKLYDRFNQENMWVDAGEYTPMEKVYISMEQIEQEKEIARLSEIIRKSIGQYGVIDLPIDSLKKIIEILNPQP